MVSFQTIRKVHDQIILVERLVVFEYEPVFARNPNVVLTVDVQLAQVWEMVNDTVAVRECVIRELFAVVSVHSFLG